MSNITTYTGLPFDPLNPDVNNILVEDIAHALSYTCRGNGHVKSFFSVAQHCINCCMEAAARGYSKRVILACLLHDASECYMSDVPRPFKEMIPEYVAHEEYLLGLIYEKFLGSKLTADEQKLLKEVDDAMLYFDMTELLGRPDYIEKQEVHIDISFDFVPFKEVEDKYLELYEMYKLEEV